MPDLMPWLIGAAIVMLVFLAYYLGRRYPAPSKPRDQPYMLAYCACCIHRDGEVCTHPDNPVFDQGCGPVYIGRESCEVRQVERWGASFWSLSVKREFGSAPTRQEVSLLVR